MDVTIPFSEACERNKDIILEVLNPYLETIDSVLEIGSGTTQHAIHFAKTHKSLQWQCADQGMYLDGIRAQLSTAKLANVKQPLEIDVNQLSWVPSGQRYPAVYTANTFHIMTQSDVERFFIGLPKVVTQEALLMVYGPFKYAGKFTSASNADFDASLRSRGVGSAIRDFELVNQLASDVGFSLLEDHLMPANNQCLIWQRKV